MVLGQTDLVKMNIKLTKDTAPLKAPMRRIKLTLDTRLHDSWLSDNIIAPAQPPKVSPLVPVAMKEGSPGVDCRELNKFTVPKTFPTPN